MTARNPSGTVKINGSAVPGWEQWTVTNNSFYESDTFSVTYSASALNNTAYTANWFSTQSETFVEIFGTDGTAALTSFIYGRVDDIEFDPVHQTITLTGRDLTGAFIDAKLAQDFTNQTASAIATTLANNHGLTPNVTATYVKAGNVAGIDKIELQLGSEWDLLAKLARQQGYVVYVSGHTLYFGEDDTQTGSDIYVSYQSVSGGSPIGNFMELSLSRSQTIVKGINVTVSAVGADGKPIVRSYPVASKAITPGKSSPYGESTLYTFVLHGTQTPQSVQNTAQQKYNQIVSHAMKVRFTMPADTTATVKSTVIVKGTGTAFDQTYVPRLLTRQMSMDYGFVMDIEAQNISPNLEPGSANSIPTNQNGNSTDATDGDVADDS